MDYFIKVSIENKNVKNKYFENRLDNLIFIKILEMKTVTETK